MQIIQLGENLPNKGRILALDVGTKRIGLAISDESRFLATPKLVLNRHSNLKDFERIKEFANNHQIAAIIIGYPIKMDGVKTEMTEFVEKFSHSLDIFFTKTMPIFLFEERLTSFEARNLDIPNLSRKKHQPIDDIAASFILQHFLDDLKFNHF